MNKINENKEIVKYNLEHRKELPQLGVNNKETVSLPFVGKVGDGSVLPLPAITYRNGKVVGSMTAQEVVEKYGKPNIQLFKNINLGIELRIVDKSGNPWFVARDVALSLEYKDVINAIKQHCKGVVKHHLPTKGGMQEVSIIPESDFYRLVLKSKKKEAEKIQDWVCEEVLPSIRKTGSYSIQPQKELSRLEIINLAREAELENQRLLLKTEKQDRFIERAQPKLEYFDTAVDTKGVTSLSDFFKTLDVPTLKEAKNVMIEKKAIFKRSGDWIANQEEIKAGRLKQKNWTSPNGTYSKTNVMITPKGRKYWGVKILQTLKIQQA